MKRIICVYISSTYRSFPIIRLVFWYHIRQICNDNRSYRNVCNMSFVLYRLFSQKGRSTVDWARWRHKALLRGVLHWARTCLGRPWTDFFDVTKAKWSEQVFLLSCDHHRRRLVCMCKGKQARLLYCKYFGARFQRIPTFAFAFSLKCRVHRAELEKNARQLGEEMFIAHDLCVCAQ